MKTIYQLCIIFLFINDVFGDEVKSVSVMEGDSLTLHTDTKLQRDDLILWRFKDVNDPIATLDRAENKILYSTDGRFKGRLNLSAHTGDLTITNIRTQHSGDYQLDINGDEITTKKFNVIGVSNPQSDQLKSVSVKDGDSVTLHTDVPDIKKYDEILWRFQGIRIAEFNKSASDLLEDKKFKDKLQLDVQTGSLKIRNIRTDLSGLYEVEISSISSSYTIHQSFTVTVRGEVKSVSVMKGDPVTIYTDVPDIKTYDQILLIFGCDEKRIAEANKQNKKFTLYGRIKGRLKLNDQTGDLTITDIKTEDAGLYELKMSSKRRTIQRRFSVIISGGQSPGAIAGISVFILLLIAALVAGGIYYHRKIEAEKEKRDVIKILEVDEGKSADLKTEVDTDLQTVEKIEWRFGETLIAEINPVNKIPTTYDGAFRGKLNLNPQTGDLTIDDIRQKHTGDYTLKIIRDGETSYTRFSVFVRGNVEELRVNEEKSVSLKTEVTKIQKDDVIEWTFGDKETLIAQINPANKSLKPSDKGIFRDKLKLNPQTGDLTINDIRWENTGVYKLKITRGGKTSYKTISVSVRCETKILEVDEGKSVDLTTEVKDIKRDDVIEWRFGETLIAKNNLACNIFSTYDGDYDLFRGKLKLNHQTGDLNINDIREKHTGVYTLKIIRDGETSERKFRVFVRDEIKTLELDEGKSVDLKTEFADIKRDDLIEWTFGKTPIAEIKPVNNIFSTSNDDLFKDKLKLNRQTGDLNINDIRQEHKGVYTLRIIRGEETLYRRFSVFVRGNVEVLRVNEEESVNLKTEVKDIQRDDVIEWRFADNGTPIAEINPANNIFSRSDKGLFRDKLELNPQTGDLNISDIRHEHTGDYTLKIIRGGKTSYKTISVSVKCETKTLEVDEWKSADLKTEVKDIKKDDVIEWRFGETLIAKINPASKTFNTYDGDDDLFRDKLKLNDKTGDLTINDIRQKHTGDYKLKIIRDGETSERSFRVFVRGKVEQLRVNEEESVDLKTEVTDIKEDDVIEWRFGDKETLIAEINPANKSPQPSDKGLFRDKLKLNPKTGDLKIKDIRWEHSGVYKLKIIRGGKTSYKTISVSVKCETKTLEVDEWKSVDLKTEVKDIKRDDVIEWRFGETLIAKINLANKSPTTYNDDLFQDKLNLNNQTGDLNIKDIREKHTGVYKLKIIRDGKTIVRKFRVFVRGKVEVLRVNEEESVDLKTEVTDIQKVDLIEWRFGDKETPIAEISPANKIFRTSDKGLFRDNLKLNRQTGDLTINDIKWEHSGVYTLKITRGGKTSYKTISVSVRCETKILEVDEGKSADLKTEVTDIKKNNVIEWRFGETLIAKTNPANKSPSTPDKEKLKLNDQTGDLNINNIRQKQTGVYKLKIISGGKASVRRFYVSVRGNVEELRVNEEQSVDLKTEVTDIKEGDLIEWRFGDKETPIAQINHSLKSFSTSDKGLFRDKLTLNHQTGDLTIKDIRWEHSGVYKLKITRGGKTSYKTISVSVRCETKTLEVDEGKSVDLKAEVENIKTGDVIEWTFEETLIATINHANKSPITYDDLFKDKLNLNRETGDLTINNIRQKHTGDYTLKITRDGETSDRSFRVFVRGNVEELRVNEEESVNLKTEVTEIQKDDVIEWRFGDKETLIAQINPALKSPSTSDKGLFRDKLKLNPQTGDLNIKDIRWEHTGVYKLKITRGGKTSYKTISVSVRCETKTLEVDEGKSADLKTEVKDIKRDDVIEWRFGETLIAKINPANNIFSTYDDDLFRGKLELNHQTGDLNINNIRQEHTGVYKLKIIRDGETSDRSFSVFVRGDVEVLRVNEEESVDLKTEVTDIKKVDLIEWRFGDKETPIAEINPANNIFRLSDKGLFRDKLKLNHQTGDLTISDIRWEHTGVYKLKIIRGGKTSYKTISVSVRCETKTLEVDEGKSVDLKTDVTDIQRVEKIEWRFGDKETLIAEINPANKIFRTSDDDLFRDKLKLNHQTGDLNISGIREKHTGVYKLKIIRDGETSDRRFIVFVKASK
ncbi:uncharacterized protein [Paramisgurnus dabryanus]|uniref:uncharacterized protein isoform X3 n=1 Tax=Paramisgurnus dabryanus TaxID=90735 RepID=UPI003CCF5A94